MTQRQQIKIFILRALGRMDGLPMHEDTLTAAIQIALEPRPTRADVDAARSELEAELFISGLTNRFTGRTWTLTDLGKHEAVHLQ